ncbi:M1 family metallopeptidase [Pedobacter puniceum]|uniref:M1 family peptidase n=1 Tax=Pedobacter puniceum TaxID=2666136 RepID=A0A7K0FPH2_9SPHI|nr:M1 family metallopeptidase [Pedobacter puniceum]MRX47879.1 M1 family peptidase [Pedobacter puniceum]
MTRKNITFLVFLFLSTSAYSQLLNSHKATLADSLRGNIHSPYRTCYDVNFYNLKVKIDVANQTIKGSNIFQFTATKDFKTLQFDLFENLQIDKIIYENKALPFIRTHHAVFVSFPDSIRKNSQQKFEVFYQGKPKIAKNAPWDGGFTFSKHQDQDWITTSCQGLGASSWWPNKDQQADEADSMLISISVPKDMMNVSNGRLRSVDTHPDAYKTYNWFVSSPINNYNVAINATNYILFNDVYKGLKGNLSLDYYVLPEHLEIAKTHFDADVKRMLQAFEYWFGPYPFYKDGFKLIETPYLGMEHQSAIAYGNKFKKGYLGRDLSGTGWGLKWDFIIVHEAGHEWFGNNITTKDIADMWVHESFTNYSESLFIEYHYGKKAGADYIIGLRNNIQNDKPIIGPYGVNQEGSGDMYYKGANMLHTIRCIINNDNLWRELLIGLNKDFALKTVTGKDIIKYINQKTKIDLSKVFEQYLEHKNPPTLEIKKDKKGFIYRWNCDVTNFNMPLQVYINQKLINLKPSSNWQYVKASSFNLDPNFYINLKKI